MTPAQIVAYAQTYKREQELLRQWIGENCVVGVVQDQPAHLHANFKSWVRTRQPMLGDRAGGSVKMFVRLLLSLGYTRAHTGAQRVILGLCVKHTTTPSRSDLNTTI